MSDSDQEPQMGEFESVSDYAASIAAQAKQRAHAQEEAERQETCEGAQAYMKSQGKDLSTAEYRYCYGYAPGDIQQVDPHTPTAGALSSTQEGKLVSLDEMRAKREACEKLPEEAAQVCKRGLGSGEAGGFDEEPPDAEYPAVE